MPMQSEKKRWSGVGSSPHIKQRLNYRVFSALYRVLVERCIQRISEDCRAGLSIHKLCFVLRCGVECR